MSPLSVGFPSVSANEIQVFYWLGAAVAQPLLQNASRTADWSVGWFNKSYSDRQKHGFGGSQTTSIDNAALGSASFFFFIFTVEQLASRSLLLVIKLFKIE